MLAESAILPNGNLWVTGGYDGWYAHSSTDIIDKYLNIKRGPALPTAINRHCIVNWNDTHMLLTGGAADSPRYSINCRDKDKLLILI